MIGFFRNLFRPEKCSPHFMQHESAILLGAVLSWGLKSVPCERITMKCANCSYRTVGEGYLPDALWQITYPPDADGWPTVNGERMAIWNPMDGD